MKIIEKDGGVLLENPADFNVKQIFDCGQAFRFKKVSETEYHGVAFGKYLEVKHIGDDVFLWPCTLDAYRETWESFFDMNTDYGVIKKSISGKYAVLKEAVKYGYGIRILRQDPWEIIISFIVSANNNIPRIKSGIEQIAAKYGTPFTDPYGNTRHAFPTPHQLSLASVDDLRRCGVGYRDKYILKSAKMICSGEISIGAVRQMPIFEAEKELLKLSGVGKKVADCILLFGFGQMGAFPVDTWVKKVISKYFLSEQAGVKEILSFADREFSQVAGYVQQYLFYYIREGIG